jgi:Cu/Ag efflux protein CusF
MKKAMRMSVVLLASAAFAVWVLTPAKSSAQAAGSSASAQTQAAQSVSGKIASVEKSSFTLTVGSERSSASELLPQGGAKTMTFQVDQNTAIDGKLKVGANADVTYRQEGGNNIAINVHVS